MEHGIHLIKAPSRTRLEQELATSGSCGPPNNVRMITISPPILMNYRVCMLALLTSLLLLHCITLVSLGLRATPLLLTPPPPFASTFSLGLPHSSFQEISSAPLHNHLSIFFISAFSRRPSSCFLLRHGITKSKCTRPQSSRLRTAKALL